MILIHDFLCSSALIKNLYDTVNNPAYTVHYQELLMKCIWKVIKFLDEWVDELDYELIFVDIHAFLRVSVIRFFSDQRFSGQLFRKNNFWVVLAILFISLISISTLRWQIIIFSDSTLHSIKGVQTTCPGKHSKIKTLFQLKPFILDLKETRTCFLPFKCPKTALLWRYFIWKTKISQNRIERPRSKGFFYSRSFATKIFTFMLFIFTECPKMFWYCKLLLFIFLCLLSIFPIQTIKSFVDLDRCSKPRIACLTWMWENVDSDDPLCCYQWG